jgi:hypothetical protein
MNQENEQSDKVLIQEKGWTEKLKKKFDWKVETGTKLKLVRKCKSPIWHS